MEGWFVSQVKKEVVKMYNNLSQMSRFRSVEIRKGCSDDAGHVPSLNGSCLRPVFSCLEGE